MKRIIFLTLTIVFIFSATVYAKKAIAPLEHQTPQSMACVDTSNTNEIEFLNCDASGNLAVVLVPPGGTSFVNGVVDIPAVGATDRTQLPSNSVGACIVQALPGNAGPIYVGGSTVTNSSGTNEGIRLNQNDSMALTTDNTNALYVAADNAGDDVKYLCN